MIAFVAHLVISAALLLLVAHLVKGVEIEGWGPAFIGALVLGLVNAIIKPVLVFLTFPLIFVTFGLFLLIINTLLLWLMASVVPGVRINGFAPALIGGVLLTVLNVLVDMVVGGGAPPA